MKRQTVVYVAGPYRSQLGMHFVFDNIMTARNCARDLWTRGYAVICPHLNSMMMDGTDTDDIFLHGDLEILSRCDVVYMLPGWKSSVGSKTEYVKAKAMDIPVYEDFSLLLQEVKP